jgi:hypothetical protein
MSSRAFVAALLLGSCAAPRSARAPSPTPVLQPEVYSSEQFEPHPPRQAPVLQACADLDARMCLGGPQPICAVSRAGDRIAYADPCIACNDPEIVAWWPETCESLAKRQEEP